MDLNEMGITEWACKLGSDFLSISQGFSLNSNSFKPAAEPFEFLVWSPPLAGTIKVNWDATIKNG
ncbi:hypothetical protein LguiA_032582 [Lonicera macranthoides]